MARLRRGWTGALPVVGPRALLPPHAAGRVRGAAPHRRRPRGWRGSSLSPRGVPAPRAGAGLTLPLRNGGAPRQALLHGHCHQKAMVGTAPTVAALPLGGLRGDGGGLGLLRHGGLRSASRSEHYDVSVSLGNRRLGPAVKAAAAGYRGGGARHLLPPADRAPRRAAGLGTLPRSSATLLGPQRRQ